MVIMAAFRELVKDIERVRDYMRRFFAYGFERRGDLRLGSARSYDNERRRVESWLAPFMSFRRDRAGKSLFISTDARRVGESPLFRAFKAKSFTRRDIVFHFLVMDVLAGGAELSIPEILAGVDERTAQTAMDALDESTVRKKLLSYEAAGLVARRREGRADLYRRADRQIDLEGWRGAVEFASEADPLGVIGSFVSDRIPAGTPLVSFKHRYLLHALDSEIICELLLAIGERRSVTIHFRRAGSEGTRRYVVCPVALLISTQTGRRYLLSHHYRIRRPRVFRLDNIRSVEPGPVEKKFDRTADSAREFASHLWGTSTGRASDRLAHIEMTVLAGYDEDHIVRRLEREKRCGAVERAGEGMWRFSADVVDPMELMPWIRTFIGRIVELKCGDAEIERIFWDDLAAMREMYGA